jgi:extracellular elastinolytic metalloproteinase
MRKIIDQRNLDYDRFPDGGGADHLVEATDRVAAEVEHGLIAEPSKINRFTGHLSELRAVGAPDS